MLIVGIDIKKERYFYKLLFLVFFYFKAMVLLREDITKRQDVEISLSKITISPEALVKGFFKYQRITLIVIKCLTCIWQVIHTGRAKAVVQKPVRRACGEDK